MPTPVCKVNYWHRSLDVKKLVECKFAGLKRNMTLTQTIKLNKLPSSVSEGFRDMQDNDIERVLELYVDGMKQFDFQPILTLDEARHYLLPKSGVLSSFVQEVNGEIIAFASYYIVNNQVLFNPKHTNIKAAYIWYYISPPALLTQLMRDILVKAKEEECDVVNCLDVLWNKCFWRDLGFNAGDGVLNFYLYNWRCPKIEGDKMGLIMI